jgi:hypothetical protein
MNKNTMSLEEYRGLSTGKQGKYRNKIIKTEEGVFRSKAELARWGELKLLQKGGHIFHLEREINFPLHAHGGGLVGHYRADAVYTSRSDAVAAYVRTESGDAVFLDGAVVEDTKGGDQRTAMFKWKAKHFKAQYRFEISIVEK